MSNTWTPEEIEAKIEAARSGDVFEAAGVLRLITSILEQKLPLPEPLRLYLIAAFRKITKDDLPAEPPPYRNPRTLAELREDIRYLERTRDANAALNLTPPRGRKHTLARSQMESMMLAADVWAEKRKGQSLERAIGTVADTMGVSEKTVSRAWRSMKKSLVAALDGDSK